MRYLNLIFTNHAIQRIEERGLTRDLAWETFNHPNDTSNSKTGSTEFVKYFNGFKTTLVARQNEKHEWVVLSLWRDPPLPGTHDAKKKTQWENYKKSGFWGKIWITFKQQLGL